MKATLQLTVSLLLGADLIQAQEPTATATIPIRSMVGTTTEPSVDHLFKIVSPGVDESEFVQVKIDYSQHGTNWPFTCTNQEEQSPLNLSLNSAEQSLDIRFNLHYHHQIRNATASVIGEGSMIRTDYPNELDNDITVFNERSEDQTYHLSHMLWKVPSEHTIDDRQLSAELQIFHVQYATDRQVAISILFDNELSLVSDTKSLKTCFFQSFELANLANLGVGQTENIDIPLKEFLDYIPQDSYTYYYGSETTPGGQHTDCHENVTWMINMKPSVITDEQVTQLKSVLNSETQTHGNFRNIQPVNGRTIWKFDNVANYVPEAVSESGSIANAMAYVSTFAVTTMLLL